jgi:exodeoxyribonuclease VII large subunit
LLEKQLVALSPFNVLNRGYAIVYNATREVISSIKSVQTNDEVTIKLNDGQIISVVKVVEEDQHVKN